MNTTPDKTDKWEAYIGKSTNYGKVKSIWPQGSGFIIVNVEGGSQFSILGSTLKLTENKAYYYYADSRSEHQRFFKALNKKQVKEYLQKNYVLFDRVYDPSDEPVDGIIYIDLTNNS